MLIVLVLRQTLKLLHLIYYLTGKQSVVLVEKMQLDVGVSPPANIMTLRLGLTDLTFDLDPRDL